MKKPSYKKLQQLLDDAETAFRQVNAANLNQGSELMQLRETIKKLSNDLEHKDRCLRDECARRSRAAAEQEAETSRLRQEIGQQSAVTVNTRLRLEEAVARVKELEAKLEAVRLVIR